MKIYYALGCMLLLTGCAASQEQRIAVDDKTCQSYGIQPGSPAYVECRMKLDQNRAFRQSVGIATGPGAALWTSAQP